MLIIFVSTPLFSIQIELYKIRSAYFDRKHKSGLYSLHSFNQLIQIILIIFLLFAFLDKSSKFISATSSMLSMSFGPKLVGLKSSVGMIKLLFFIPTVNLKVLS
jgi:hypothetical protein